MTNIPLDGSTIYMDPVRDKEVIYQTTTLHGLSGVDIFLIVGFFVGLAYFKYYCHTHKEEMEHWINPNGREVNLYKVSNWAFWGYVAAAIVLSIIQIYIATTITG